MSFKTASDAYNKKCFYEMMLRVFLDFVNEILLAHNVRGADDVDAATKARIKEFSLSRVPAAADSRMQVLFAFPYLFEYLAEEFVFVYSRIRDDMRDGLKKLSQALCLKGWQQPKQFTPSKTGVACSYRSRFDKTMSYRAYRMDAEVGSVFLFHVVRVSETPTDGPLPKKSHEVSKSTLRRRNAAAKASDRIDNVDNDHVPASSQLVALPGAGITPKAAKDASGLLNNRAAVPLIDPAVPHVAVSSFQTQVITPGSSDHGAPASQIGRRAALKRKRKRNESDNDVDADDGVRSEAKRAKNLDGSDSPFSPSLLELGVRGGTWPARTTLPVVPLCSDLQYSPEVLPPLFDDDFAFNDWPLGPLI
eukprot:Amastigsp_a678384_49.p1 type:complete len:363 gc:universal Amastigsp_a678384_49:157-1245(+)